MRGWPLANQVLKRKLCIIGLETGPNMLRYSQEFSELMHVLETRACRILPIGYDAAILPCQTNSGRRCSCAFEPARLL